MKNRRRFFSLLSFLLALSLGVGVVAQTAQQRGQARDSLNAGIRAYRSVQYAAAIEAFKRALALDPELLDAELYMANAYAALFVPSESGGANQERAANAIAAYGRVLAKAPDNVDAVAGLGRVYQAIGQLRKAREYFLRTAKMAPASGAPFFAVGAVDWAIVADRGAPLSDAEKSQLIDEGFQHLDRTLAFEPGNSDALLYENLLLREKALLTSDGAEKARLLAQAEGLFDQAIRARRGPAATAPPLANNQPVPISELARPTNPDRDPSVVRIGVLHSLSGTLAISEISLRDAVLMAVDEINASGGVLGKKIEPVVVDPASDWPLFAEKAKQLLSRDHVAAVFGCWTSVSRKSVLPVFESLKGLLFYPVQYEGEEQSPSIFYTGAPNQQVLPAAKFLMSAQGGAKKKFYLLGTDYVYPRTANKVLKAFLLSEGIPPANIVEEYTPFGHNNYQDIVRKIKEFGQAGDAVVMSTINGDSNVPFYKEFANQGLRPSAIPVMAFSIAEDELRAMETEHKVGHLAAWNYFQSIDTPENKAFVDAFKKKYGNKRVTDDPIEAAYAGVYLWKAAVEKAGSFDVDKVTPAVLGLEFDAPGGKMKMHPENHHTFKPVYIGRIRADGQFDIVWKSDPIEPEAFSPFLRGR